MKTPKSLHSTVTMLTSDMKCVIAFFSKRHDLGEKLRLKLRTLSVYCSEALAGNIVDIFLTHNEENVRFFLCKLLDFGLRLLESPQNVTFI